jgi:hypothetical protein
LLELSFIFAICASLCFFHYGDLQLWVQNIDKYRTIHQNAIQISCLVRSTLICFVHFVQYLFSQAICDVLLVESSSFITSSFAGAPLALL